AATLYGTEASAGVIQIITKRGSVGAPEFEIEVGTGTNYMRDPAGTLGNMYGCAITAAQCPADQIFEVNLYDEANHYMRGTGRFAGLTPGLPGFNHAASFAPPGRDSDLLQNGLMQRYNLSVRGGTDQVRYYLSGSFLDEAGTVDYNTNSQVAGRANVTVLFGEDVNVDFSTGYSQGHTQFATVRREGGVWHQLTWGRPNNLPGVRPDNPLTAADESLGSGYLGFQERFPASYEATNIYRDYQRFTGSMTASHRYGDWLSQRLTFGIDRSSSIDNEFIPGRADFPNAPFGSLEYGRPMREFVTFDYSVSGTYNVTESFGTRTSVGAQYYTRFSESVVNSGTDFPTEVQTVISQTELATRDVSFSSIEEKTLGFYVEEQLSWEDRIFVTGAMRGDDNSAFGANFELQYYPKVSASWVVSEEAFWNVGFMNSFRLRGAWGKSGRQPGTFASQTLYGTRIGPNGNGLIPTTAGNPDIGPEVSTELEVGFDAAFLDDRLSGTFSWYTTKTEDMLVTQSLAPSIGLPANRDANLGELKNWGWEAQLNARVFESPTVAFDLAIGADNTQNEIVSLGENALPNANFQIGWPFPNIATDYIIRDAQMNAAGTTVDLSTVTCDAGLPAVDGGPNILRGGATIACSDYDGPGLLLGPSFPKYSFSVAPTLTLWQDLQVFALAEGQYGRWIANIDAQYACGIYANCLKAVERTDPRWIAGRLFGVYGDDRYQGRFPADFWTMRQIGLRYTLPSNIVSRVGGDRASLSISGNNLFRIWQKVDTDLAGNPIYDPEYAINSNDPAQIALWELPGIASINATLRVTF
ncbi:MAG TPA: TonB-dependent receptor, partial [Longimicrobiales bacterium]|nr:TonB-dependent receptor [Longimicrobiales bacterium]